jgi:hypothetical protein
MSYSNGIGFTCGEGNDNTKEGTIYIDSACIKGWGINEDGLIWIETDYEGMEEIADCAASITM